VNARPQPRVMCVDDETRIVDGLAAYLGDEYEVVTASNGPQALQKLRELGGAAVVVSDMRMPGMSGAALLSQVMQLYPETSRILLTGDPSRDAAVIAVNQGQIFRFLTKPCAPGQLRSAVEAGVLQYRLINAERSVLQETVIGCIKALVDVLAITQPAAFGRTGRVTRCATEFATSIGCRDFWQLEAAAMLSQLGCISLPSALVDKLYHGELLTPPEQKLVAAVPAVATKLLNHIPRLESVLQILSALSLGDEQLVKLGDIPTALGARILGLALHYDTFSVQGHARDLVMQSLRTRSQRYGAELVEKFAIHLGAGPATSEVRELALRAVRPGMTLMQDVHLQNSALLVPKGFEITATFVERIVNFGPELLARQVQVVVRSAQPG
jgi:response regulator RpfG family c-di-GMP phosphodiesterase